MSRVRIHPKLPEAEVKISEPDPKLENTRTGFIVLYQNIQISEIPDPNPNGYPNVHP